MGEWTRPAQPIRCVVELDKPLTVRRERWLLAQGDANANAIVAEVYQTAGKPYDLTGCTVMLTFVRPDNLALPPIEAEISGNTAIATLKDACYEVSGVYVATVQMRKEGAERTILWLIGDVKGKDVDGIVDPDREVISIEDLMATASEAQKAASAANAAANRANAGADRVEQMQIDASGLAGDSNKLGGKAPEYYLPAVNLLDNSYFRRFVNQMGGGYSNSEWSYGIDRWICQGNGIDLVWHDRDNMGICYSGRIVQPILDKSKYMGKIFTLAVCDINGYLYVHSGVYGGDAQDIAGWVGNIQLRLYSDNETQNMYFSVYNGETSGFIYLQWAALYEGSYTAETLPPYVPKGYAAELAECQRYLYVVNPGVYPCAFWQENGNAIEVSFELPVPMDTRDSAKSYDFSNLSDFYVYTYNGYKRIYKSDVTVVSFATNGNTATLRLNWNSDTTLGTGAGIIQITTGNRMLFAHDL